MSRISIKKLITQLDIRFLQRVPLIHQTESSECGLACLAMICGYYKKDIDLLTLRQNYNLSARGTTLSGLTSIAESMELNSRPLSLELEELGAIKMPCILHWEFNHYVVLVNVRHNRAYLHDPALGHRIITLTELSHSFTGVALEVWPRCTFTANTMRTRFCLAKLISSVHGLKSTLGKIFFLSLVIETINLMIPVGTQLVMDHAIPAGDRGLISIICISLMGFILMRTVVSILRSWSSLIMTTLINLQWQTGLFNHLLRLPLSYFERRKVGDIQSRFSSLNTLRETFANSIVGALMDGIMVIGLIIMMALYGGWLTWLVLGFTIIYVLIRTATYDKYRRLSEETLIKDARNKSYFMETLFGISTVKIQGIGERRGTQWLNLEIDTINSEIKVAKMELTFGGINSFIGACDQIVILWFGTSLVIDNNLTIGMFIAFGAFRQQFEDRVTSLVNFFFQARMLSMHNERIADIALHSVEPRKPAITVCNTMRPVSLETYDLGYSYDDQSAPIFSDLCIGISPGESVAITGNSGAGKTTLMRILCGLLEPSTGRVIVDGVDVKQIGINNYQKMIGCVMQDDRLFSGSIRDNICGFEENKDEEWMIESAKVSYIHNFITTMPMGYDTLVGELGEGLSGGQKQRIFIARALYRKPSILFMDEATSSLDHLSESYVNKAIKELKLTRIIIAHRETTVAYADRIITLG